MKKILSTVLAAGALLFTPAVSSAQDSCCETMEGMYVGMFGGVSWGNDIFMTNSGAAGDLYELETDTGWNIGGFIGYRFCNGFRTELEVGYRELDIDKFTSYSGGTPAVNSSFSKSDFSVLNVMGNFIYECSFMVCDCCWRPFFGFGIGGALVDFDATLLTTPAALVLDDDEMVFAYQLIVGLAYPVNECMDVAVEYRFMGYDEFELKDTTGNTIQSRDYGSIHSIAVSAKYIFGGLW